MTDIEKHIYLIFIVIGKNASQCEYVTMTLKNYEDWANGLLTDHETVQDLYLFEVSFIDIFKNLNDAQLFVYNERGIIKEIRSENKILDKCDSKELNFSEYRKLILKLNDFKKWKYFPDFGYLINNTFIDKIKEISKRIKEQPESPVSSDEINVCITLNAIAQTAEHNGMVSLDNVFWCETTTKRCTVNDIKVAENALIRI